MLCSDSLPLALLCPKIFPIMPHYALNCISLKIDTNGHYGTAVPVPQYGDTILWYSTECNNIDFNKWIEQTE